MYKKNLGSKGPSVSAMGLGCMSMSEFYGKGDDAESRRVILKALEMGITMLDTADQYGSGHNEELIGDTLREWKEEVFVATKSGIVRRPGEYKRTINNRPEYIREALEKSLKRLRRDHVDLYYIHRRDHSTPLEDAIGELSKLVEQGKIRYIGLSEVSAETILKADTIHHVTAVQSEYSLFTRGVEESVLDAVKKIDAGFVPYSPLGRGFLTGKLSKEIIKSEGDLRQFMPRTSGANYETNNRLVKQLEEFAAELNATPAQVALAWVMSRGENIVPIPGTRREKYLLENIAAADVTLDKRSREYLETVFYPGAVKGERYSEEGMVGVEE